MTEGNPHVILESDQEQFLLINSGRIAKLPTRLIVSCEAIKNTSGDFQRVRDYSEIVLQTKEKAVDLFSENTEENYLKNTY